MNLRTKRSRWEKLVNILFFENWDFYFCQFCWIFCFIISAIVTIDWLIVFLLFKLTTDPFDCSDCHLTWLIRDNRRLLPFVAGGYCSNGTIFEDLNPSGYENCPVIILLAYNRHIIEQFELFLLFLFQSFTCPLGYDGAFPDPLSCTSYYICRGNVAFKSVNIKINHRMFSIFLFILIWNIHPSFLNFVFCSWFIAGLSFWFGL